MDKIQYFESSRSSLKIAYSIFKARNEKYALFFLTGRAEYYFKYESLFTEFNKRGVTVFAMDHRGQGASGRILGETRKGYVEDFSYFVDDAEQFLKTIILKKANSSLPIFALSHSMGGAVLLLLCERAGNFFSKVVFASPMWGFNFMLDKMVFWIARASSLLGFGEKCCLGKGLEDYDKPFSETALTHDREKFEKQRNFIRQNPSFALGGPTYRWLSESLKAIQKIEYAAKKTDVPVLLLQAGDDRVVNNKIQNKIAKAFPNVKKIVVQGAWHELLNEADRYYSQTLDALFSFLFS